MDLQDKHIHFVGIGGAGLSAIARVLLEQGAAISGSDLFLSPVARALAQDGAQVYEGHHADHLAGAELVVVSSAVPEGNVEVQAARAASIPVVGRAEVLGWMMAGRVGIAIAGTHGKTTTTGMVATILWEGGLDPTFIVGGVISGLETNARAGTGPHFVVEADEYDRAFLGLRPQVAVITNVEHDHPDCYPQFAHFRLAFADFVALLPPDGLLVVCRDDPVAAEIGAGMFAQQQPVVSYGLEEGAMWMGRELRPNPSGGTDFLVVRAGQALGEVRLRVPGRHNVLNALAALAVSDHLGVPFPTSRSALANFRGANRRFETKGEVDGVTVVDDYAHHPTEIQATLEAAHERFPNQPLWAVWQPHTYSRTRTLFAQFTRSFDRADHVLVLPIYAAREQDTLGVSHTDLAAAMGEHPDARAVGSLEEALVVLGTEVMPHEVVLTMGAGDGDQVGEWLLTALQNGKELEE
ncbi:MAG: UDP-N-acetylmuramate--L-alanine ligase [Anaerolineae bacterium]|nr:UDP-N-acetylmuramate--L-alanine ligase [Anaerolineae bacterium]